MSTTVSNYEAPPFQSTTERQAPAPRPAPEVVASPSDPNVLRRLYSSMLRCRILEQKAAQLAGNEKRRFASDIHPGGEATSIGSMMELRAGDAVSSDGSVASRLMCGQSMELVLAELYHLRPEYLAFSPSAAESAIHLLPEAETVEAQLNIATGYAMALRRASAGNVVLVYLPEAFSAFGYWHQAAKDAATGRLPLIFVAVSKSLGANDAGDSDLRDRAGAYGIPGMVVDGDDVVAVWRVTQESIYRARGGYGPTVIHSQIVSAAANSHPPAQEGPLARMQRYLEKRNLWDEAWKRELVLRFDVEVEQAASLFPHSSELQ